LGKLQKRRELGGRCTENTEKSSLQPTVYSPQTKRKKEEREREDRFLRKAVWAREWGDPKWHKSGVPSA
jgi:hypothetical protein